MGTIKLLKFGARNHLIHYALLSIVYLQICNPLSSANVVCDTPDCRRLANYYKQSMNEQGKPCTDFYDYVCHGWAAQNPRPKHKFMWNTEQFLQTQTDMRLRELLENPQIHNKTIYHNVRALYRACMNLPLMEISNASTVSAIMTNIGNWPMFPSKKDKQDTPWWQIETQYIAKTGFSSFFEFHYVADLLKTNEISFLIFGPYSPFGTLKIFTPMHPTLKNNYKAFLTDVINAVAPYSRTTRSATKEIDKDLEDVIAFREKLANISKDKFTLNATIEMKIGEFQEWYDKHDPGKETTKINWLAMIRSFNKNSKDPSGKLIQLTTKITVSLNYFSSLSKLLGQISKRVIAKLLNCNVSCSKNPYMPLENHIHLYFAEAYLKHDNRMVANLEKSVIAGVNPTGQIRYEPERWEYCIRTNNLGITLSEMYLLSHFSSRIKQEVEQLLKDETELLKIRMSQSSWLDRDTIRKSVFKLDKLQAQIGFPDWYLNGNLVLEHFDYDINPTTPGAFFAAKFNRIGVSASYLQWPLYVPDMPYQLKFGGLGTALGHELSHGFDNIGLQFDGFGNNGTWWSQDMLDKFYVRLQCIEELFQKHKREELRKRNITTISAFSTTSEDVADVMGLKISFMGYKNELQRRKGTCQDLQYFEKFGCDKMFFFAFAHLHCDKSVPSTEEVNLLAEVHSFPRTRVNAAVGNIEEFHQIFGCKPGDPMVPKKMCDIWK